MGWRGPPAIERCAQKEQPSYLARIEQTRGRSPSRHSIGHMRSIVYAFRGRLALRHICNQELGYRVFNCSLK